RIPVLSAYELLISEGYLHTIAGEATCVSQSIPDALFLASRGSVPESHSLASIPAVPRTASRRSAATGGSSEAWLESCGECCNLEHFPIGVWSKLISRHARKVSRHTMGYGDPMGYAPFREALAEYLRTFRAVKCDPEQILVTTGCQQALLICALSLLDPGDGAWIEDPASPQTRQTLSSIGVRLLPVPVDEQGLNVHHGIRATKGARAAFVTPAHQFPMGVSMTVARRLELLSWAAHTGAWIVEDDYDSEFRFSGSPIASLQGLDAHGRVIYVGTLGKVMFPTLKLGFAVVPKDLLPSFLNIRS